MFPALEWTAAKYLGAGWGCGCIAKTCHAKMRRGQCCCRPTVILLYDGLPHPHCLTVCIFEAVLCLLCSFWVCSALQYTYTVLIVQCQICAECAVSIVQSAVQDGQTETLATEPANQDDSGNDDQADDNEHHDC